jgi:hypothetical protein
MTEVGRGSENDNGAPGENMHGHRCDDAVGGAVGTLWSHGRLRERYNESVRGRRLLHRPRGCRLDIR